MPKIYTKNEEFKELLKTNQYDFLKDETLFPKGLMYLTLGGSYAYGTNKRILGQAIDLDGNPLFNDDGTLMEEEPSDVDFRGISFNFEDDILVPQDSLRKPYVETVTDTTIYYFDQFFSLLFKANPNIFEFFGVPDEKIFFMTPEMKLLKDNIDIFLTQKVFYTFGNYADDQLGRLQNALLRDRLPAKDKIKLILKAVTRALEDVNDKIKILKGENNLNVYIGKSSKEDLEEEILISGNFKDAPLTEVNKILNAINNPINQFGKLNKRNKKKSLQKLEKHKMHLIRLKLMCCEILEGKGIITDRTGVDLDFLMNIRNGGMPYEELMEWNEKLTTRMEYSLKHSELPKEINIRQANDLCKEINYMTLKRYRG